MNKQIFVINGMATSGKDSFVDMVNEFEPVYNVSSVDIIKSMAQCIGWNGSKTEKDRKFLSDLKRLCGEYNDSPFTYLIRCVVLFKNHDAKKLMFVHIREPEEIKRFAERFGAKTILVKNDKVKNITSNMADANVYNYEYDYIIENNGTLIDLKEKAKHFVEEVCRNEN
jgi:hypothetical protein